MCGTPTLLCYRSDSSSCFVIVLTALRVESTAAEQLQVTACTEHRVSFSSKIGSIKD